jgi:SAM-dependent methyltransferase
MERPQGLFQGTEIAQRRLAGGAGPDPAGVLAKVGVKSGMDVVDLCSGDGWFTLQIVKIASHVVAIDIDPLLLEVARHRLREADTLITTSYAAAAQDSSASMMVMTRLVTLGSDGSGE